MLYLIATPIGNLGDITLRAIETLKNCDYILAEDTRHSGTLLKHYGISTPLHSFHKFSEATKESEILDDLRQGKTIGLISDAGTPGISDPGTRLVKSCVQNGIKVSSIPGPCAAVAALSCSGLNTDRFQFIGFLPRTKQELRRNLQQALMYPGTTVCYESPNRLCDLLEMVDELAPERKLTVARELTKVFEEVVRGTASELLTYWRSHTLKGEIVLLISEDDTKGTAEWTLLSPEEHVEMLQNTYSLPKKEAIKMAAELRGVPKREIYNKTNK